MALPVPPAALLAGCQYQLDGFVITKLRFRVPLDYQQTAPGDRHIPLTVRIVTARADTAAARVLQSTGDVADLAAAVAARPLAVYAVGGPGSDNPPTDYPPINDFFLAKGYQMLYMDYRGTGGSLPLRADRLVPLTGEKVEVGEAVLVDGDDDAKDGRGQPPHLAGLAAQQQADLLALFRQDNIVRDFEAVRKALLGGDDSGKWLLLGQSYGGWVAFTYLSFYPEGLAGAIVTGGVPPVGCHADTVYRHLYASVVEACGAFYRAHPGYEDKVRTVLRWIVQRQRDNRGIMSSDNTLAMPRGGFLTPERFLCIGRMLGVTNGPAKVRAAIDLCIADLEATTTVTGPGTLRLATRENIETWIRFEERPLYAILQEPIYTEAGVVETGASSSAADWSALRVGRDERPGEYWWLQPGALEAELGGDDDTGSPKKALFLSAEHVYPCHYAGAFRALRPLAAAADLLARRADWPPLYDAAQLAANTVPVAALLYARDIFINPALSRQTADATGRLRYEVDGVLMHTAIKDTPDLVLPRMWALLEEVAGEAVTGE